MNIQVSNLGIADLGTVYLGKMVVKRKIITIPGGVASFANTTISNVGVDINNLNIYNRNFLIKDQVKLVIKREIQPTVKTIIKSILQKDAHLFLKEKSIFKVIVLASPGLVE